MFTSRGYATLQRRESASLLPRRRRVAFSISHRSGVCTPNGVPSGTLHCRYTFACQNPFPCQKSAALDARAGNRSRSFLARRGLCDCLRAATRQGHPTVSQNYPHFVAGLSGTLRRSLPLTERLDTLRPLVRYRFAKARLLQTKRCEVNMPDKEEGQLAVAAYATDFLRGPSIRRVATS
jgi:hypothetical protein